MKMHRYANVDVAYFDTAPVRFDDTIVIARAPDVVWKAFESNKAWHAFDSGIAETGWTSPPPLRPGSTRRVKLIKWIGGGTIDEVFFLWKPTKQLAFYMHEGTSNWIEAYGEQFILTDLGNARTEVRFRTAFSLNGSASNFVARMISSILNLGYKGVLKSLKDYVEKQPQDSR